MIVLDTNVVSALMQISRHATVMNWLDRQPAESLFISSITIAESLFGLGVLPAGKRRDELETRMSRVLSLFDGRVLPFDERAARRYADLAALARASGRAFPAPDAYVAAIAASHAMTVATRDTGPFVAAGLTVIDPWSA